MSKLYGKTKIKELGIDFGGMYDTPKNCFGEEIVETICWFTKDCKGCDYISICPYKQESPDLESGGGLASIPDAIIKIQVGNTFVIFKKILKIIDLNKLQRNIDYIVHHSVLKDFDIGELILIPKYGMSSLVKSIYKYEKNNLVLTKEVKIESFVETIAMCDIYVYVPKVYLSHTKLYKNYKGEDYVQKIIPIKVEYLK